MPPFYDSNLAKVIVWAETRADAITRMRRCLDEFVIEGIPTNIPFLKQILDDPRYRANAVSTAFLPTMMEELGLTG